MLSDIMDDVISIHQTRYSIDASELVPMIMLVKDDAIGPIYLVPDIANPSLSHLTHDILQMMVDTAGAEGYIMSTEAWIAEPAPGEDIETMKRPSQHDNRMEVLMVAGYTQSEQIHRMFKIIRDKSVVQLEEHTVSGSMAYSRFDIYRKLN